MYLFADELLITSLVVPEMMFCLLGGVVGSVLLVGLGQLNFCYMFI